jgi:hypothetical protein
MLEVLFWIGAVFLVLAVAPLAVAISAWRDERKEALRRRPPRDGTLKAVLAAAVLL